MNKKVSGGLWVPKKAENRRYVCLWKLPTGEYFSNGEGDFLSAESRTPNNKEVEFKMTQAAKHYGYPEGKPVWFSGRKVTSEEKQLHKERMLRGLIPDPVEERIRREEGEL